MRLYYSPGACSLASNIAFAEAGQAYELSRVDLGKHLTEDGRDFYAINPKGYVPYLELDDGESISEGVAILQFIADTHPSANLAPVHGTMARVKLNEWLTYINSEVHKTLGGLFDRSMPADYRAKQVEKASKRFDLLSATLSKQDYILASGYSVADAYLFTVLNWTSLLKIDLSPWPALVAYQARVSARPKVQEALRKVGLLT
jgi:glutathione S-transferase